MKKKFHIFACSITDGPRVVTDPNNAEALSGQSLTLTCTFEGRPAPNITWIRIHDGIETLFSMNTIMENGRTFTISSQFTDNMRTSVFNISSSLVSDGASYLCMAANRLGSENSTVSTVSVYGKEKYLVKRQPICNFCTMVVSWQRMFLKIIHALVLFKL